MRKVGFKLTKNSNWNNYKEKVSWNFKSLGSGPLGKGGDSGSFPRVGENNINYGYLPNRIFI